jgi:hypothetical protein
MSNYFVKEIAMEMNINPEFRTKRKITRKTGSRGLFVTFSAIFTILE